MLPEAACQRKQVLAVHADEAGQHPLVPVTN